MSQGICVCLLSREILLVLISHDPVSLPGLTAYLSSPVRSGEGLRGVAPEGVEALIEESVLHLLPVHLSCFLIECIVGRKIVQKLPVCHELLIILCSRVHVGPDRHHGMYVHFMEFLRAFLHVAVALFVQDLVAPFILLPGVPVLYYAVNGYVQFSVSCSYFHKLRCGVVLFLGLHISVGPLGKHRGISRQISEACHYLIHALSGHEVVVQIRYRIEEDI